jgi:DNA-binding GntR family transcriptional regulator
MTSLVYEQLHAQIVSGELAPGARLTESVLATTFGISRTPVREALRRLEQDGLVERAAHGMLVKSRSPQEILEIYEVRIILEEAAARSAALNATELDLARLRQLHLVLVSSTPDDLDRLINGNRRFHEQVWSMSHNSALIDLLNRINSLILRYRGTTLIHQDRWVTALEEHTELLQAIESRDPARAAESARRHMALARDFRQRMYVESVVHDI